MKYLLNIACFILIVATVQGQTTFQPADFPYNKSVLVVRDTISLNYTTARSYNWISIPKATNIAVLGELYGASAEDDTLTIAYLLRNSKTGAVKASASLGTLAGNDDIDGLIGTIADTTFIGYDQVRFTLTLTNVATTRATFKLYLMAYARSGGQTGVLNQTVTFNELTPVYYKTGFTASTANDTLKSWIPIVGADYITLFANANDSLVANIYYRLTNSTVGDGITTSWVNIANATNVAPFNLSDTTYRIVQLKPSHLAGYEKIQFYVDYQANSTDGGDGTAGVAKIFGYFFRRD